MAADTEVSRILKGVEDRYNHALSLHVAFTESHTANGRKRVEKGELFLRKPGKMRWQYSDPAGKLYVSDGKFVDSYIPADNRAERMKFKEADDMRAPLAFLLGRLQFKDDFREFRTQQDGDGPSIFLTAIPKSDKLPYTEVTFLVDPDFTIRWLDVKGQDNSQLDFAFSSEKRNPSLPESMFHFTPPHGVEFIDSSR